MKNYTYTYENNIVKVITNDGKSIIFIVDPSIPEPVYDRNNLLGYTTLPGHALLYEDFKNVNKLEVFVDLMYTSPSSAYSQYLSIRQTF